MYRGLFKQLKSDLLLSHLQENELYQGKFEQKSLSLSQNLTYNISLNPFIDYDFPFKLTLTLFGERIINTKIERGFMSSGLENLLSSFLSFDDAITHIRILNYELPYPYMLADTLAIEDLYAVIPSDNERKARTVNLELSRIKHHNNILKNIFFYCQKNFLIKDIENSDQIDDIIYYIKQKKEEYLSDKIFKKFLGKTAMITQHLAASYGLTGLFLRANRVKYDNRRRNDPGLFYPKDFKPCLQDGGDLYARTLLRFDEIISALKLIKSLNHNLECHEDPEPKLLLSEKKPTKTYGYSLIEAPEGDLMVSLFCQNDKITWRIKTPSYFILQALPHFLHNRDLTEASLIIDALGIIPKEVDK